jgi:predicted acyltransferase
MSASYSQEPPSIPHTPAASDRLLSLDALRGFDMLWIVGGARLAHGLKDWTGWPWASWWANQMHHPEWVGFTAYDQIFPLFLFMAGIAIPMALQKQRARGVSLWKIHFKLLRRALTLIALGVIYNGGLQLKGFGETRFASVLGLIGIGYYFAALIVLHAKLRAQVIWLVSMLLAYWAALSWIPVPGGAAGVLTPDGSLAAYVDRWLLPGRLHAGSFDPEGLLPSFSSIGTALAGALTGHWLMGARFGKWQKAGGLLLGGAVCIGIAQAWQPFYPVIKKLWTGSYIMLTTGISMLLLCAFYLVIDVMGLRKWAFFFVVFGMNSITIYMLHRLIDMHHTSDFLFEGLVRQLDEPQRAFAYYSCFIMLEFLLLLFLYRKRVFLRV